MRGPETGRWYYYKYRSTPAGGQALPRGCGNEKTGPTARRGKGTDGEAALMAWATSKTLPCPWRRPGQPAKGGCGTGEGHSTPRSLSPKFTQAPASSKGEAPETAAAKQEHQKDCRPSAGSSGCNEAAAAAALAQDQSYPPQAPQRLRGRRPRPVFLQACSLGTELFQHHKP